MIRVFTRSILVFTLLGIVSFTCAADLVFSENFDTQDDWHSGLLENRTDTRFHDNLPDYGDGRSVTDMYQRSGTHRIPENWFSVRQGEQYFSPRNGIQNARENIEILESNSNLAYGNVGKSAVFWRESHQENSHEWLSDGILLKYFEQGFSEVYIEFWIKFDPESTTDSYKLTTANAADASKIFQVYSWNGIGNEYQGFENGPIGPVMVWGWGENEWGVRNGLTFRGGPHGENYYFSGDDLAGAPTAGNFTTHTERQGPNGVTEQLVDRKNGGLLIDNYDASGLTHHDQVFGDAWTKMAFYLKMNSAIGSKDGEFIQWVNGRRIYSFKKIPWAKENEKGILPLWNVIALGGNDYFHSYPLSAQREEWYSIDNLKVYNSIPAHADDDISFSRPKPPIGIVEIEG